MQRLNNFTAAAGRTVRNGRNYATRQVTALLIESNQQSLGGCHD